eukprot:TRINITY_DN61482_c0_g1_i4.p1 TRINITY_DN61482_c0_g1~~TRINITY_DN61482_c0_g1_i4.p1  ORF type:complete len:160 (+),score=4.06 TRINITY_DN61482_c0_g1_i4:301-780(+)
MTFEWQCHCAQSLGPERMSFARINHSACDVHQREKPTEQYSCFDRCEHHQEGTHVSVVVSTPQIAHRCRVNKPNRVHTHDPDTKGKSNNCLHHLRAAPLTWVPAITLVYICLLYTSDAADEEDSVDLGGRRIIKKKKHSNINDKKKKYKGINNNIQIRE